MFICIVICFPANVKSFKQKIVLREPMRSIIRIVETYASNLCCQVGLMNNLRQLR